MPWALASSTAGRISVVVLVAEVAAVAGVRVERRHADARAGEAGGAQRPGGQHDAAQHRVAP